VPDGPPGEPVMFESIVIQERGANQFAFERSYLMLLELAGDRGGGLCCGCILFLRKLGNWLKSARNSKPCRSRTSVASLTKAESDIHSITTGLAGIGC
jgi:hypothetical protein